MLYRAGDTMTAIATQYADSVYDYEKALAFFINKFKDSPFIPYIVSNSPNVKSRITMKVSAIQTLRLLL